MQEVYDYPYDLDYTTTLDFSTFNPVEYFSCYYGYYLYSEKNFSDIKYYEIKNVPCNTTPEMVKVFNAENIAQYKVYVIFKQKITSADMRIYSDYCQCEYCKSYNPIFKWTNNRLDFSCLKTLKSIDSRREYLVLKWTLDNLFSKENCQ